MGEKIATRNAYGQALAELANQYPEVVCFDADLAGATMSKFFLEAHPEFELIALPESFPGELLEKQTENGLQLLGCRDGVEGFYICRMRRKA